MAKSMLGNIKLMDVQAAAKAATVYSSSIRFDACAGDATIFLVSTAGSITVTQQCSLDDSNWYDPVNASGSAVGSVASAFTVSAGTYITYTVVLAPYVRFKVVEGDVAATDVSLKLIYRFER